MAQPIQHFKTIFGVEEVKLVDTDGSPTDPADPTSGRGNAMVECCRLFCELILRGVRTIVFCKTRGRCEGLLNLARHELEQRGHPETSKRIVAYRGGYTADDRRKIESDMFDGQLLGIIATTALELGIDIGTLDCVLIWGFPYTISNLRQQSGRAGRRNGDSLSILLGDPLPSDQHYMRNPDNLFSKLNDEPQIDLQNILLREGHIQCAAHELPIQPDKDAVYFGADLQQICQNHLTKDDLGFYHCHVRFRPSPSSFVCIRNSEEERFAIIDTTNGRSNVLEDLEASRATFTIYDGAIYLHQGEKYLVRDFQPQKQRAFVELVKVNWTTRPRDFTDIDPVETDAIRKLRGSTSHAFYGTIKIEQKVFGFFKVDSRGRLLDAVMVDNPSVIRHTKGLWLDVPKEALELLRAHRLNAAASIHAAEHAILSMVPTLVPAIPGDVRTECKAAKKEFAKKETTRKRPGRLTIYDAGGGASGSGVSTRAFEHIDSLLRRALVRVEECRCTDGCMECVASELCYEGNEVITKVGAGVVLKSLLNISIDVDELPMGNDNGIETIIVARAIP
ncbi:hypothetical protein jhhlp_003476 [Lomentospora prolificans]|uniref:Helicase C-terminal domain-containing protein n=1 Tax=Lomentospora prolificans TaxID=41688 RepID=A0A2N3N8V8_9PEZI|nr:hypothetical protein jhhlp_003476 [Lomentospora prolificans]